MAEYIEEILTTQTLHDFKESRTHTASPLQDYSQTPLLFIVSEIPVCASKQLPDVAFLSSIVLSLFRRQLRRGVPKNKRAVI